MSFKGLQPLIKWPGGKRRLAKRLAQFLPKHETYVEPFAGGAGVFFRKQPSKKEVLGDTDPWLIRFYDQVRKGGLRKCEGGFKQSRSLFERAKKRKDACHKFALITTSFHGDRTTYGNRDRTGKVWGTTRLKRLSEYEGRLRRTHLRIGDFERTLRKFDSTKTVHFLDPPWPLGSKYSETYYRGGKSSRVKGNRKGSRKAFDPYRVREAADRMKGSVVVIYRDHPDVRRAFQGRKNWQVKRIQSQEDHTSRTATHFIAIKKPKRKLTKDMC